MTERTAVLFLTHTWTRVVRARLERLRREIGDAADVFPLLQSSEETRRKLAAKPDARRSAFLFDPAVLPRFLGFPYFRGTSIVPGSAHYPLLAFARTRPEFARYFVIEHDVDFSGDWGELIGTVAAAAPDFAASHFGTFETDPAWPWWSSLKPPPGHPAWQRDRSDLRRTFNPVYCISPRAIAVLEDAHRTGWRGHFEVLIATLLAHNGCRIADLAELGGFYVGTAQDGPRGTPVEKLSTMRWRPAITPAEFRARSRGRTLFHPVKGSWFFDGTRLMGIRRPAGRAG